MIQSFLSSVFSKRLYVNSIYIIVSLYIFFIWIWSANTIYTSFNGDPNSKLSELIYGTAHKPYVKRALVPFITRSLHSIVPGDTRELLEHQILDIPRVQKETIKLGWEQEYLSEYLIALLVVFVCLVLFSFVVRKLWKYFYDTDDYINNIIPVTILLVLPTLYWTGPHYIYDFSALLLFTLGMYLLLNQKWFYFYPVFVLGCFNKETFILITFLYFIFYRKSLTKFKTYVHLAVQVILFVLINVILSNIYSDNPGTSLNSHILLNIRLLVQDYSWTFLLVLSGTLGLVFYDFGNKPIRLRQSLTVAIPFALLIFTFGIITELRATYELVPIVVFLILHTILFSILKLPYKIKKLF